MAKARAEVKGLENFLSQKDAFRILSSKTRDCPQLNRKIKASFVGLSLLDKNRRKFTASSSRKFHIL